MRFTEETIAERHLRQRTGDIHRAPCRSRRSHESAIRREQLERVGAVHEVVVHQHRGIQHLVQRNDKSEDRRARVPGGTFLITRGRSPGIVFGYYFAFEEVPNARQAAPG